MVGTRAGESVFNWHRVSASDEKVLEMDGGDGHTPMCVYLVPVNFTHNSMW